METRHAFTETHDLHRTNFHFPGYFATIRLLLG